MSSSRISSLDGKSEELFLLLTQLRNRGPFHASPTTCYIANLAAVAAFDQLRKTELFPLQLVFQRRTAAARIAHFVNPGWVWIETMQWFVYAYSLADSPTILIENSGSLTSFYAWNTTRDGGSVTKSKIQKRGMYYDLGLVVEPQVIYPIMINNFQYRYLFTWLKLFSGSLRWNTHIWRA